MKKYAYGVETVELVFNESKLIREFERNGCTLINSIEYHADPLNDSYQVTYLFRREGGGVPGESAQPGDKCASSSHASRVAISSHAGGFTCSLPLPADVKSEEPVSSGKFDPVAFHRLAPNDGMLGMAQACHERLGLTTRSLTQIPSMPEERQREYLLGEYYAYLSALTGQTASDLLLRAQWRHVEPEWFDHRHHTLNPGRFATDYWAMSAHLVLLKLPLGGRLLDFCSGDGYYDHHFFSKRASEIVAVELNPDAYCQAVRLHKNKRITYVNADVLTFEPAEGYFDVVVIRGAIEHFSRENQHRVFQKARRALKPRGWFCGDTVARLESGGVQLESHECEWADEAEMRRALSPFFHELETLTYTSSDRVTLFWQARKE